MDMGADTGAPIGRRAPRSVHLFFAELTATWPCAIISAAVMWALHIVSTLSGMIVPS